MAAQDQRHLGLSQNVSPAAGIEVRRAIPIADSEKLVELGDELRQRIARMGIPEREELLARMQAEFPDPALDRDATVEAGATLDLPRFIFSPGTPKINPNFDDDAKIPGMTGVVAPDDRVYEWVRRSGSTEEAQS